MAADDRRLIPLSFGRGIANRVDETAVPLPDRREGTPGAARQAVNVDLPPEDRPRRRAGWATVVALAGGHSLWSCDAIDFALYAAGGELRRWEPGPGTGTAIAALTSAAPVSYTYAGRRVWWSNGTDQGSVTLDGQARHWGVDTPASPAATVAATGGLFRGTYLVTLTYLIGGEEGGAPEPVAVEVPEGGGVLLPAIPQPTQAGVTRIRVYMTGPQGTADDLRQAQDLPVGTTSVTLGVHQPGKTLDSLWLRPVPPADHLLASKGHVLGAVGRYLVFSQPVRPGLYDPRHDWLPLPANVTLVADPPGAQGFAVLVGTRAKTYLIAGDSPRAASMDVVHGRGAQPGTLALVPGDALGFESSAPVPVWIDTDGQFVAGTAAGVVVLNKLAVAPRLRNAAAAYLDLDGLPRYLAGGRQGGPSRLAMGDKVTAFVVDHGAPP